jgi:transcription-repair coupling factor (superfamily II helicase)
MKLIKLLQLIREMPVYHQLLLRLKQPDGMVKASLIDAAKPYFLAALVRELRRPILVVTAQPENSRKLEEQVSSWLDPEQVWRFPEPDALPYLSVVSDSSTELERIRVLSVLTGNGVNGAPPLVIASAVALTQKVAAYVDFASAWDRVKVGAEVEPFGLLRRWQAAGYEMESTVEAPGMVSHRGGIVDVYPPTSRLPVRIEYFGNTVDSLRLFEPQSQRSMKAISEIDVGPANTRLLALSVNQSSILDYLPQSALLVLDEPSHIRSTAEFVDIEAEGLLMEKQEHGEIPDVLPRTYLTWSELEPAVKKYRNLALTSLAGHDSAERLNFTTATSYASRLPVFIKKVKQLLQKKHRLILVSHQASRLSELLAEADILATPVAEVGQTPPRGSLVLVQGLLAQGWIVNGNSHLFTDNELFGFIKQRRLAKKRMVPRHKLSVDITPGDYVVHIEHGIARFGGIITMTTNHVKREYLVLQYAAGDRLYVPTDQIDRVGRYIGASDRPPVLSRLGAQEWTRAKGKAKESAENAAREMLALYAAREVVPGFNFSPDTVWQQELEASFPYVETPDQESVQQEVKADMARPRPMDRLVCGDVGYGKTEVALRAAFKAVMDGKQVALLVPTTVLAQQHFVTFTERLGAFPVRVEVLSRFKSSGEQSAIVSGLANGSVDICIGTHRLLQKDVIFKDLGLLIIDEEQRFGVNHKEYLKKVRREVDVLTLSATPIPRTLHMSLVGVRDMSIMETPPEERLPIKTFVSQYSDRMVREAILRELERNGQVFFVHNRVQSITLVAEKLRLLVPEAKLAIAHGQMAGAELESVMADFTRGRLDVLVCTTIIESGLDVANANTLVVNRADRFGLPQLYQLRGRVGRGANLAYAYFLYEGGRPLSPDAEKRLGTIFEATELGAGFGIAMKDLEIRGAGSLLGTRQSGHITAVGFNLYTRLLGEAVEEIKAKQAGKPLEETRRPPPPTIDLPLPAYIPEDYVPDVNTRLSLYQCLVGIKNSKQLDEIGHDFEDRFGPPPLEVKNLLYAVSIKLLAARVGIESITVEGVQIVLRLFDGLHFDRARLGPVLNEGIKPGLTRLRLDYQHLGNEWQRVLAELLDRMSYS